MRGSRWPRDDARGQRAVRREVARRRSRPSRNARHKGMLKVILGEMLEHKRLFDQAAAGRKDLIGTSLDDQRSQRRRHARSACRWTRIDSTVAIALGSNLGDREAHLAFGLSALPGFITNLRQSSWHDTAPVGVSADQPRYLNGVVVGETSLERARAARAAAGDRARSRTHAARRRWRRARSIWI